MATKTWVGGDASGAGDLSLADNWKPLSIRNATVKWTASGSGTNEYYMEAAAGGDPSAEEPGNVQEDGTNMTEGTAGSLTAGQWDWGDNDTLGYSTVYVRLTGGTDPDSQVLDFLTYTAIPIASDDVVIPAGSSNAIDDGLQVLAGVSLGAVSVQSFTKAIASSTEYLRLTCTALSFEGTGTAYIDIQASAIAPEIFGTAMPSTGLRGLYLLGSAITTLHVSGGSVGLAWRVGETATATTVKVTSSGSVWIGSGATVTTVQTTTGSAKTYESLTTLTVGSSTVELLGTAAVSGTTTVSANGHLRYNSSGTLATVVADGTIDTLGSTLTRTISSLKLNPGAVFKWDKTNVTVTAFATPDANATYTAT